MQATLAHSLAPYANAWVRWQYGEQAWGTRKLAPSSDHDYSKLPRLPPWRPRLSLGFLHDGPRLSPGSLNDGPGFLHGSPRLSPGSLHGGPRLSLDFLRGGPSFLHGSPGFFGGSPRLSPGFLRGGPGSLYGGPGFLRSGPRSLTATSGPPRLGQSLRLRSQPWTTSSVALLRLLLDHGRLCSKAPVGQRVGPPSLHLGDEELPASHRPRRKTPQSTALPQTFQPFSAADSRRPDRFPSSGHLWPWIRLLGSRLSSSKRPESFPSLTTSGHGSMTLSRLSPVTYRLRVVGPGSSAPEAARTNSILDVPDPASASPVLSSCIFLTLSLRLIPSPGGLLLIFLHALTIVGAATGCAASPGSTEWRTTHMVATMLTAIFQGSMTLFQGPLSPKPESAVPDTSVSPRFRTSTDPSCFQAIDFRLPRSCMCFT